MSDFFSFVGQLWVLMFGWMPTTLAVFCTVLIGIVVVFLIIKLIAFILKAIPFI